jgi:hypothetical protein
LFKVQPMKQPLLHPLKKVCRGIFKDWIFEDESEQGDNFEDDGAWWLECQTLDTIQSTFCWGYVTRQWKIIL